MCVLGGRAIKANVELHDVRWVVGSTIEETYETFRKQWFGLPEGLHIDSYKKITHVDCYRVNLNNLEENNINSEQFVKRIDRKKSYGLSILEVITQVLCKKNMSLDLLSLQVK